MQSPRWLSERLVSPDDSALLTHTGGTTGIPKGAALARCNILANITQSIVQVSALHEGTEVFYCVLPSFHAFGLTIGLPAGFRFGVSVALFPKFDTTMILTSQKRLPRTFFLGIPPMYEYPLKAAEIMNVDLSSMTLSLSGAIPLSGELAKRWEEAIGGLMVEGYGITKASLIASSSPLPDSRRPGALGIPFPSTRVRIVGPKDPGMDAPEGEIGELIVKGPQVLSGYWKCPEETTEALWSGWLCTGDLMRVQDDFIHIVDRRKEVISTSGFSVYPSQVEDAARDMPGICDITVIGLPAGDAGENMVAAIVLETGVSIILMNVCQWAEKSIAHYALPRQIVVMIELSRSQLGKVTHKKVREQIPDTADSVPAAVGQVRNAADQIRSAADQIGSVADSAAASAVVKFRSLESRG